jgi:preprotein translocase subunit YajC
MSLKSIINEIHVMNNDQLNDVIEAVKFARAQNHRASAQALSKGDKVYFDGKHGATLTGVVQKVAIKYVTVDCGMQGRWRVPAAHLKVAQVA